jgi:hypothetical protein
VTGDKGAAACRCESVSSSAVPEAVVAKSQKARAKLNVPSSPSIIVPVSCSSSARIDEY